MREATQENNLAFTKRLHSLLFFSFSDKLKFSIKASLSMALAYLIPLSQGWSQASTAAITVMLIAAMGSVSESVTKGAMRMIGTIVGAVVGMTLIAIFPQERFLFLLSLSLLVAIPLYLVRAYKGDPSIFMLTAMTMMMVFKSGEVDDVFLFGLDKTYMTIFGIMVYTLVGVFLWPVSIEDSTTKNALELSKSQSQLFLDRDAPQEQRAKSLALLLEREASLESSTMDTGTASIDMQQWHSMVHNYKNINANLTLLSMHDKETYIDNIDQYISNYKTLEEDIVLLFNGITLAWEDGKEITLPEAIIPEYERERIKVLSHLDRASLITTIQDMKKLHEALRVLATKLNRIHSPLPTFFDSEEIPQNKRFVWGDVEHLKGVLVTFMIFWTAIYFWITMNPPGGFMIVALATGLSVLTTFSPLKPSLLIIIFSLSFVFATFMYVFVLPHLHYGWELGLFIFVYSFISFYFINPKISIFFLLGLFTLNIMSPMYYNFSLFLSVLLMFYLFLMLLQMFYFIPFSTRPEHLFLELKNRFFKLSQTMLDAGRKHQEGKGSWWGNLKANYAQNHLMGTVKKMQLWGSKIDEKYFDVIDKHKLLAFTKESEKFAYLLELLYDKDMMMKHNPLLKNLIKNYTFPKLSDLLGEYVKGKAPKDVDDFWKNKTQIIEAIEDTLSSILAEIDFDAYSRKEIAALYENISLRRNVWLALFDCQEIMAEIDFNILKQSRF
ncbi:MAG: FUSC family protein [Sulfurovum sp.]|nr:FUSC family protein [Sulfurovum sp.]